MNRLVLITVLVTGVCAAPAVAGAELRALVYHDIVDGATTDDYAVSAATFRGQMRYLQHAGYRVISLQQLEDAVAQRRPLPEQAVLLTFDDGLVSFSRRALPVLREFGYPAVLSVCTGWLDGQSVPEPYRGSLLTWEQLRMLKTEPLVEIATHSDRLHEGIPANPQGTLAPAATTRQYDPATHHYEAEKHFLDRVQSDLSHSVERIKKELGTYPRALSWPYGFYDGVAAKRAEALGLRWQLGVGRGPVAASEFPHVDRMLVYRVRTEQDFERLVESRDVVPRRLLQVAIHPQYAASSKAFESWLSTLLDRAALLRIEAVVVDSFSSDGKELLSGAPPAGTDVLHRLLYQLRSRLGIRHIWLRLPSRGHTQTYYSELARRLPYDGIVLASDVSANDATRWRSLFESHRPGLRCGTDGKIAVAGCSDFHIAPADPAERAPGPESRQIVYAVASSGPDENGKTLVEQMGALERKGWRYLGLSYDGRLDTPSVLSQAAVILNRATATGVHP